MNGVHVRTAIRGFLSDNFSFRCSIATLSDADSLLGGGVLDSVGILAVISFLEETFEISVGDDEVEPENFDSIDSLAAFVLRKAAAEGRAVAS